MQRPAWCPTGRPEQRHSLQLQPTAPSQLATATPSHHRASNTLRLLKSDCHCQVLRPPGLWGPARKPELLTAGEWAWPRMDRAITICTGAHMSACGCSKVRDVLQPCLKPLFLLQAQHAFVHAICTCVVTTFTKSASCACASVRICPPDPVPCLPLLPHMQLLGGLSADLPITCSPFAGLVTLSVDVPPGGNALQAARALADVYFPQFVGAVVGVRCWQGMHACDVT